MSRLIYNFHILIELLIIRITSCTFLQKYFCMSLCLHVHIFLHFQDLKLLEMAIVCSYNACSAALCNKESLASYLRCLTSIELFLNSTFYAKHPIIEQQHNKAALSANTFAMCLILL